MNRPRRAPLLVPLLHAALARQKEAIERILSRSTGGLGADDLHDIRVALRRTSALAQLARGVPEKGDGDALHAAARDLRRLLSGSRTTEVLQGLLEERAKRDRLRAPLLRRLARGLGKERRRPGRRDLATRVALLRAAFARREADLTPGRSPRTLGPRAPLERALRKRVEKRLERRRRAVVKIGVPDRDSVHALRIASKQLRYELEPLEDVIPGAGELLALLRSFQTTAGDAHDRIELAEAVAAAKVPPRDRLSGEALRRALAGDATRAVAEARRQAPELLAKIRRARLVLPR